MTTNESQRAAGSRLSVRARLLIGMILLAGLTLLITGTVNYVLERQNLESTLDDTLTRDVEEFRVLADTGIDPDTQQHFTRAADLMYTAMQYNHITDTQSMLAMQDGEIVWSAPTNVTMRLENDSQFVQWASQLTPESVYLTSLETDVTRYRSAVVPVQLAEDEAPAVFLTAFDVEAELHELRMSLFIFTAAGAGAMLIGGVVAWLLLGRMLQPVRDLQENAQRISEQDLDSRIQARGHDEFAELTETINHMLDRLQLSLEQQKQLLDDVGHELRTPITIIRGHLEVMDDTDPVDVRQTKDIAIDELHRMSLLVNDLVTLAQSNSTDFIATKPTDIAALMHDITAKAAALGDRDWSLKANANGDVNIDGPRLTQAMLQLCANAVKFSGPGSPIELGSTIRLSIAGDTELCLWVADAGIGISPEDQQTIFKRFGRGGNGQRAQGSGLGLNIVEAIALAHGGSVHVESAPGQGSIFILTIPLENDTQSPALTTTTGTLEPPRFSDQEHGIGE
ncbi:sensor histidine kinase [Enteractinococcus helveticum]|uniref:sensor histidine kinase n=1 Tax=Enteractinococcus helveticum TaxID=1837282 RepID=UPI0005BC28DD|nr:HAMP domain-containing sensor histidine kinase [Enteractinococcus helveticum]